MTRTDQTRADDRRRARKYRAAKKLRRALQEANRAGVNVAAIFDQEHTARQDAENRQRVRDAQLVLLGFADMP